MRILGIDPGEKRIGTALSDQDGNFAKLLELIKHKSREKNAAKIAQIAQEHQVGKIIVGQATFEDGTPNFSGRLAARLAGAIRDQTDIPVILWDESYSSKDAEKTQKELGVRQKKRRAPIDNAAAAIILQSYLDAHPQGDQ